MPYDIARALDTPNIIGNGLAAAQAGRKAGQQNALAGLASQAYTAPAGERRNALVAQAVGVDPTAGLELGKTLQANDDSELKTVAGAAKYVLDAYKSGNAAQLQGAYRATIPLLTRLGARQGKVPPPEFSEDMLPGLYQVIASAGGDNATAVPLGFRQFEMTAKAAGLQPGTPEYQKAANIALGIEGRASNAGIGFQKVTGADGRERIGRSNPRTGAFEVYNEQTGQFESMGGAAGSAPAFQATITEASPQNNGAAAQANALMAQGMTAEQAMQQVVASNPDRKFDVRVDPATGRLVDIAPPSGNQLQTSQTILPAANPGLGVSRSPEETAAAVESAKQQVGLQYLPQQKAIENQAAIQQEQGKAQVKNEADMTKLNLERSRDAQSTLNLLNEAEKILPDATGSGVGRLIDASAGAVGVSTEGAQATARLQTIAGQLTSRMPRMQGPQSDKDVLLYKQMAGDLANPSLPVATRTAALQTIRALNEKYVKPKSEGNSVDDLLSKYGVH